MAERGKEGEGREETRKKGEKNGVVGGKEGWREGRQCECAGVIT